MAKRRKRTDTQRAKDKAWKLCSEYTRRKYADKKGYVTCYTCPTTKPWKEMQAGHGIEGRGNGILFEERCLRPQCFGCNMRHGGRPTIFHVKLQKEYGYGIIEELLIQSKKAVHFTLFDYEEKISYFKKELDKLSGCKKRVQSLSKKKRAKRNG